jgi:hypothetical protein
MDNNVEEFKYLQREETWNKVLASNKPHTSFNLFMNTVTYYFNTEFPLNVTYVRYYCKEVDCQGFNYFKKQIVTIT